MAIDPEKSSKPVFLCQGQVYVEEVIPGKVYLLLEDLDSCKLHVGDEMPPEWSILPANRVARDLLYEEQRRA